MPADMVKRLLGVMIEVSLATRIEFVLARTEDEVRNRLADARGKQPSNVGDMRASLEAELDDMWKDFE
jgi:hypothetical protein